MTAIFKVDRLKPVILSDGWHEYTIDMNKSKVTDVYMLRQINNTHAKDISDFDSNYLLFELSSGTELKLYYTMKCTIPNSTDSRRTVRN